MMLPIEYVLSRRMFSQAVADRIRKLNPHGYEEGSFLRGWFPHRRSIRLDMDLMPVHVFIARFGRNMFRSLPREAFYRSGHRKAVRARYCFGAIS